MVAAARETFGRLDYLVNNAGINPSYGPMLETDIDSARKILEVNVLSAFSWTQKAVGAGLGTTEAPGGAIVNVASIAGLAATGLMGWYAVSKAAMIHLTAELGYQLGPDVRVNAVAPGIVKTAFSAPDKAMRRRWPRRLSAQAAWRSGGHRRRRLVPALRRLVLDDRPDHRPGRWRHAGRSL